MSYFSTLKGMEINGAAVCGEDGKGTGRSWTSSVCCREDWGDPGLMHFPSIFLFIISAAHVLFCDSSSRTGKPRKSWNS